MTKIMIPYFRQGESRLFFGCVCGGGGGVGVGVGWAGDVGRGGGGAGSNKKAIEI